MSPVISTQFYSIAPVEVVVDRLASIAGLVDLYCWYEGTRGLPASGATFMQNALFKPLYQRKKDVKVWLYSLCGWDFSRSVSALSDSNKLGKRIDEINKHALECFYSASFFKFCAQIPTTSPLYAFVDEQLPKKQWLLELSVDQRKKGVTVAQFFDNQSSLFDCIKELDVAQAYSPIQYIEGYYLIREAVRKRMELGEKAINVAFALPNDEEKYYRDYPTDIGKMLQLDLRLEGVTLTLSFHFFRYGENESARPYMDRLSATVRSREVVNYFNYLENEK